MCELFADSPRSDASNAQTASRKSSAEEHTASSVRSEAAEEDKSYSLSYSYSSRTKSVTGSHVTSSVASASRSVSKSRDDKSQEKSVGAAPENALEEDSVKEKDQMVSVSCRLFDTSFTVL